MAIASPWSVLTSRHRHNPHCKEALEDGMEQSVLLQGLIICRMRQNRWESAGIGDQWMKGNTVPSDRLVADVDTAATGMNWITGRRLPLHCAIIDINDSI